MDLSEVYLKNCNTDFVLKIKICFVNVVRLILKVVKLQYQVTR